MPSISSKLNSIILPTCQCISHVDCDLNKAALIKTTIWRSEISQITEAAVFG